MEERSTLAPERYRNGLSEHGRKTNIYKAAKNFPFKPLARFGSYRTETMDHLSFFSGVILLRDTATETLAMYIYLCKY